MVGVLGGVPLHGGAHPLFWCSMISIFLTPYQNTELFQRQHENISSTIGVEHEFLCTLLNGDNTLEWYREYTAKHGIRSMVVPDLSVVNLINILAARAIGDYLLYISDIVDIPDGDKDWGKRAIAAVDRQDKIMGGVLSMQVNDQNCTGLFMPVKTFHVLGYYCCPIFETPIYGYRWNASILTEVERLVNIQCGMKYFPLQDSEAMSRDKEIYNVTRPARLTAAQRLSEFIGGKNG